MNIEIVNFLKKIIKQRGVKYIFIAQKTQIEYQRLMRIFNQNATISASELVRICRLLEINQNELINLIDEEREVQPA